MSFWYHFLLVLWVTGFRLVPGKTIQLTSINFPNAYPLGSYVLWTFQSDCFSSDTDIVYHISVVSLYLASGDVLNIGSGWDPDDYQVFITSYQDDVYGGVYASPHDVIISSAKFFVEFASNLNFEYHWEGFQLEVSLRNIFCKYDVV